MPRGLQKIAQLAEQSAARAAAFVEGGDFQRALVLQKGDTARGRFLEEGESVTYVYTHELPKKPGARFGDKVLCLDQDDQGVPCRGCELENVGRGTRVVLNFLRYDEPKLVRDKDGKAVKDGTGNYQTDGTEMKVVVFNAPTSVGGRLAYLESQNGAMTKHVVTIHRTHDDKNPWMIDIAEKDKLPPSPQEVDLFNKKLDPLKAVTQLGVRSIPAMSYGDMVRAYGGPVASGFEPGGAQGQPQATPENNVYAQAAQNEANKVTGAGSLNLGAFGS